MKVKKISKTTTNRYVFNRSHKIYLERKGKIRCSRCGYHKNENYEGKWYGWSIPYDDMVECSGRNEVHTRYPNWKLVSKNRKQWMAKPIKIISNTRVYWDSAIEYFEVKFPA